MKLSQNILCIGLCGGMLLLVSADVPDAKAVVLGIGKDDDNPDWSEADSVEITIEGKFDTVQRPLKFNPFEATEKVAQENFKLLLEQRLTKEQAEEINDFLKV